MLGGQGDDTLFGQAGPDRLFGGSGRDRIYASLGGDFVDAGSGADRISAEGGDATIMAGGGDDVVTRRRRRDRVQGGGGSDRIRTGDGADQRHGRPRSDAIDTGAGDDEMDAVDGRRDRVDCGDGDDIACGRPGRRPERLRAGCERTARRAESGRNCPCRASGLTVAVTGPTGDLGIADRRRPRALARGQADRGDGAPAVRPGRARLEEDRVPPGRRDRRGERARPGQGRRRGGAPGLRDPERERRHARAERRRARGSVFEESAKAGAERICLRVERGGLRLPRRQPGLADRGRPGARLARSTPTRSRRPRSSGCSARCCCAGAQTVAYAFRPCIVAGPEARTMLQEIPYYRLSEAMPDAVRAPARLDARAQARDPRPRHAASSSCTRTTWRRAFVAGVRGLGEPGPYNLAGGGTLTLSRPGRRARLVLGAGARSRRGRHRRGGHAAAARARLGGLDPLGAQAGADEDRPRAQAARAGGRSTRRGRRCGRWSTRTSGAELARALTTERRAGTARRSPPRPSRAGSGAWCRRPSRPRRAPGSRLRHARPGTAAWAGRAAR